MNARRGSGRFAYSPDLQIGASVALQWSEHRADQPTISPAWAATDRGWLNAAVSDPRLVTSVCLGHYLDYPHSTHADGRVYAVSCVTQSIRYCRDVIEARTWIEGQARGQEIAFAVGQGAAQRGFLRDETEAVIAACVGGAS